MRIEFEDGSHAEADAMVGCDGVKSHILHIPPSERDPDAHAGFTGKYAYRGLVPTDEAIDVVREKLAINSQMWFGYHGHLVTFTNDKGNIRSVIAFRTKDDGKWKDVRWVIPTDKEDMLNDFAG